MQSSPVDGRVFVVITRDGKTEPRRQFGKSAGQYRSVPFFGEDVSGFAPGQAAVIDQRTEGYPLDHLSDLPKGDYFVQGVLNVYTTFHRADGHDVKLHMDQWEGQDFPVSPGNLYSEPKKISLDPRAGATVRLSLDHKIPPIAVPADSELVKHVRFESPLLTKFWGHPILIGATILLPRDYARETIAYPVHYEQGHFSTSAPGGFDEAPALKPDATEREKARGRQREEFVDAWKSDHFPRMLYVTFQHPTPYYDDSYAIDSPNGGPYGRALLEELIPYIESHFRVIREPWARILSGGSTGGWESLALQVFHPDFFGGTFTYCPDPVDFHYFEMVNIYEWDNAWERTGGSWLPVPIPGERAADGLVLSTMRQQLKYERVMGNHGRSGEDWDCWQAVYGPVGADGYFQPLFDPMTGNIDHGVAAYWKEHTDINAYLQRRWKEIGPALAGKIHIWTGDADTYYLNDAVYLLEDFLKTTTSPGWGGSIVYGPRQPHCWTGPLSLPERIRQMAEYAAAKAPRNLDRPWWRD